MSADVVKKKKKSGCLIAVGVAALVLFILFLVFYIKFWIVPDNSAEVAEIRDKAWKITKIRMDTPPEKNAWYDYKKAIDKYSENRKNLKKEGVGEDPSYINSRGLTENNIKIVKQYMAENKETLDLIKGISHLHHFQEPVGKVEIDYNSFGLQSRQLFFFLLLTADIYASENKYVEAADLYTQTLFLAVGTGRGSYAGKTKYSNNVEYVVLLHLYPFIEKYNLDPSVLRIIIGKMEEIQETHHSFVEIMDNEMATEHLIIKAFKDSNIGAMRYFRGVFNAVGILDRDERMLENQFLKDREAAKQHYSKAIQLLSSNPRTLFKDAVFIRTIYPDYRKLFESVTFTRSFYNGIMLCAAVKCFKKEKGKYPDNLSQLVPEYLKTIPKDYYSNDGKFIYKKDKGKVVLYSIGRNLKDEGGKTDSDNDNLFNQPDMVFLNGKR